MRPIIFFIWLFTALSIAQEKPEMEVYIKNDNMEKGYRTLTTTFTDSLVFKKKFKDSNYSLDYVLRYYYATAIDLGCDKNELISMSGLVFPIESVKLHFNETHYFFYLAFYSSFNSTGKTRNGSLY